MLSRILVSNKLRVGRCFSKSTRMSSTPRIFRDPDFTKTGFRSSSAKRKQHNLEGVPNAHLYYDKKVDEKIARKQRRAAIVAGRFEPAVEDTSVEAIMKDLTNFDLVSRASGKLFIRISQLQKLHPQRVADYSEYIGELTRKLCTNHIHKFNARELAILLSLTTRFNKQLKPSEFENVAHYVFGRLISELYNGKSLLEEPHHEERLSVYLSEITQMYRFQVKTTEKLRAMVAEGYTEIAAGLAPHVAKFRSSENLFRVATALAHVIVLPSEFSARVQAETKEQTSTSAVNNFLLINRTLPAAKFKPQFSQMFEALRKAPKVSKVRLLQDFLDTFNLAPGNEEFKAEAAELVQRIDRDAREFRSALLISATETAYRHTGKTAANIAEALQHKAEAAAAGFSRSEFYRYFRTLEFTGALSPRVVTEYLAQKRTAPSELEFSREQLGHLLRLLQTANLDPALKLDELRAEFEADLSVQSKEYSSIKR